VSYLNGRCQQLERGCVSVGWREHFKRAKSIAPAIGAGAGRSAQKQRCVRVGSLCVGVAVINDLDPLGARLITNDPHSRPPQTACAVLAGEEHRNGARAEVHRVQDTIDLSEMSAMNTAYVLVRDG
jgi:hypothetical protein